jgi:hypothetical protein
VPKVKKEKTVMALLEKMEVLDTLERGMRIAVVGCCCDVGESTVCFLKKNEDRVGGSWKMRHRKDCLSVVLW